MAVTAFAHVTGELASRVREVTTLIEPAEGVSVYDALHQAHPAGFRSIEIHDNNTATITWIRED